MFQISGMENAQGAGPPNTEWLRMTSEKLNGKSKEKLARLARKMGISGSKDMGKAQLIRAIVKVSRRARPKLKVKAAPKSRKPVLVKKKIGRHHRASRSTVRFRPQLAAARDSNGVHSAEEQVERSKYDVGVPTKDLSAKVPKDLPRGYGRDRIVVMVRDPYWLHAYWEVTRQAVSRAEAALGQDWHGARPILRVLDVSSQDTTSTSESIVRDIDIHGGVNNWYIDVANPPRSYRVDIGYVSRAGQFYVLARSNVVSTPRAGISDTIDENWADIDTKKADRIYAMSGGFDPSASSLELKQLFEERLRRPMGSPAVTSFGSGAFQHGKQRKFFFKMDAELIVYGETEANARVTLQGEPVKLRPDGTFTMRFGLPDSRQIIPATAASADGVEERTIVLAVERNTKQLEPMIHEVNE